MGEFFNQFNQENNKKKLQEKFTLARTENIKCFQNIKMKTKNLEVRVFFYSPHTFILHVLVKWH